MGKHFMSDESLRELIASPVFTAEQRAEMQAELDERENPTTLSSLDLKLIHLALDLLAESKTGPALTEVRATQQKIFNAYRKNKNRSQALADETAEAKH